MSTTSFTYFEAEDRLLLVIEPGGVKLWLTRRLCRPLLTDIAALFERTVPGAGIPGAADAAERMALEHMLAMHGEDMPDGDTGLRYSATPPARAGDGDIELVTGLDAKMGSDYAQLTFNTRAGHHYQLRVGRAGFHRLLRTLLLCADKAGWQIADAPPWLQQSLLPPQIELPDQD